MPKDVLLFLPDFPLRFLYKSHTLMTERLVTGTAGLGDDTLELVDLLLGTAESTELLLVSMRVCAWTVVGRHTLFLASLRARLSLEFRRSSMTRRS